VERIGVAYFGAADEKDDEKKEKHIKTMGMGKEPLEVALG